MEKQSIINTPVSTSHDKYCSGPAPIMPTAKEVAALAYQLWIERGSSDGSEDVDWYEAELELTLRAQRKKPGSVV